MNRIVRLRLLPGSKAQANQLHGLTGACRFAWNKYVQLTRDREQMGSGNINLASPVSLQNLYPSLRRHVPWLSEYSAGIVRDTVCRRLAKGYGDAFKGVRERPTFHSRKHATKSFDMYGGRIQIKGSRIRVEKIGWMDLQGPDLYRDHGEVKVVTAKYELGKWYAYLCYEIEDELPARRRSIVGLDLGTIIPVQCSDGSSYHLPDMSRVEARRKRYQRRAARRVRGSCRQRRDAHRAAKCYRKQRNKRRDWAHNTSKEIAAKAGVVAVEDLNVEGMTAAGGAHKRGLNREITKVAWAELLQLLDYKAWKVVRVDPRYTSQECSECGHTEKANRRSQSRFKCARCGCALNADLNAAINVAHRALRKVRPKRRHLYAMIERPDKAGHLDGERRSRKRPHGPVNHIHPK